MGIGNQNTTRQPQAEFDLLLCCARMGSVAGGRVRGPINWNRFLRVTLHHGVLPLVHGHFEAAKWEGVPDDVRGRIVALHRGNRERNLFLAAELLRLQTLLERAGVRSAPFKGPDLAESVYGDLALRQFNDLDILIDRQDFTTARDLLQSLGYRPAFQLAGARERAYLKTQSDLLFTRDDRNVPVELAWGVVPRYFGPHVFSSGDLSLPPEDYLLALCVHGTKHLWRRLIWACDVAQFVQKFGDGLDWDRAIDHGSLKGYRRALFLGLDLSRKLLDAPLPKGVADALDADRALPRLLQDATQSLIADPSAICSFLQKRLFQIRTKERRLDRLRYWTRLALTPTPGDWRWVRLPDRTYPLYYVLRPIRLASRLLRETLKRFWLPGMRLRSGRPPTPRRRTSIPEA